MFACKLPGSLAGSSCATDVPSHRKLPFSCQPPQLRHHVKPALNHTSFFAHIACAENYILHARVPLYLLSCGVPPTLRRSQSIVLVLSSRALLRPKSAQRLHRFITTAHDLCSTRFRTDTVGLPVLSRRLPRTLDEPNDIYDTPIALLTQRQQRLLSSFQRPQPQSRPSSSSGSTHTLRRTPRFELRSPLNQVVGAAVPEPRISPSTAAEPVAQPSQTLSEQGDGSTTPRQTTRTPLDSSYWPQRSTHISRRTASAILFALEEALRRPNPFTPDLAEENATMSDLGGAGPAAAAISNGRTQNGGSRAASGTGPTPQYPTIGAKTPTEIMRERRKREEKKHAENEARQKQKGEEDRRQAQEEAAIAYGRPAGVASGSNLGRAEVPGNRGSAATAAGAKNPGEGVPAPTGTGDRRSGGRAAGESANVLSVPTAQPSASVPRHSRVESMSAPPRNATQTGTIPNFTPSRQRASTASQVQPKPIVQQQTPRATSSATPQQPQTRQTSTAAVNSKEQADPPQPRISRPQDPAGAPQPRNPNSSSFPHAFERWETLSSHWEGLTSFWIRRLQQNSDEMNREPLNQQLARQVTDLSAAGANLFHAVVELQRLRASSERKFQRWFFETRAEQEKAKEVQAGLENTLRTELQARVEAVAESARLETEKNTAYQIKSTAEQMVKEMRRELQISKEEARRAWEELGRREQEERDRTTSLRNGEPTLVGGVQVVPMVQGGPSRQGSNRPSTREGPFTQGGNLTSSAQAAESIQEDEPGYTTYDPTRSETDTDPFTEGGRANPSQPSYQEPFTSSRTAPTSPPPLPTSNGSAAVPTPSAQLPSSLADPPAPISAAVTAAETYLRYGPDRPIGQAPPSSFYQHRAPMLHDDDVRPGVTRDQDERSYVQSVDTMSEESWELDDQGQIRLDARGRPIPMRGGPISEDSDELDVRDQQARELIHRQTYGSGIAGVEYGHGPTGGAPSASSGRSGDVYVTTGAPSPPTAAVDYSGSMYGSGLGWETVPRNHHPTRLSDVIEEDERSRTSPSRASQASRGIR